MKVLRAPGDGPMESGSAEFDRLTLVMPVTLRENRRLGLLSTWRKTPDLGGEHRLRFALASLVAKFDMRDLSECLLICPADEVAAISRLAKSVTSDPRVRIVPELDICPDILRAVDPKTGTIRGWYAQQMLKLAAAEHITTPFYLTCDSDIVCFRKCSAASLITAGRAACGTESYQVYTRIYTPEFAAAESRIKQRRMDAACELLGGERTTQYTGRFYSETPVLFHTEAMQAMLAHLSERHHRSWAEVLATEDQWTEISLYFVYLEMAGRLESLYRTGEHNRVLHLEGSVWQISKRYPSPRPYDRDHFARLLAGDEGVFIAIQSYLDARKWLPATGFSSLEDFYLQLAEVLALDNDGIIRLERKRWRWWAA